MRQRFTYRDDSLWWFTEIYLHKMRQLERGDRTRSSRSRRPRRTRRRGSRSRRPIRRCARRPRAFGRPRGSAESICRAANGATGAHARWHGFRIGRDARCCRGCAASDARARRTRGSPPSSTRRSGATRARTRAAAGRATSVRCSTRSRRASGRTDSPASASGPRRNFRSRRWWDPIVSGPRGARSRRSSTWRRARRWPSRSRSGARRALAHAIVVRSGHPRRRPYGAATTSGRCCERIARARRRRCSGRGRPRRWTRPAPRSTRSQPQVVVTYAEAGGWGRALMLEARRRGDPVGRPAARLHLSPLAELPPRGRRDGRRGADGGFPRPDVHARLRRYRGGHLRDSGHLPDASHRGHRQPAARRTGRRRSRASAAGAGRAARSLGVGADDRVVVVAAKFTEIATEMPVDRRGRRSDCRACGASSSRIRPRPADVYRPAMSGADAHDASRRRRSTSARCWRLPTRVSP